MSPIGLFASEDSTDEDNKILELQDLLSGDASTAGKSSASLSGTPALVEVITQATIRNRGYRYLADVLNDLPDNHEDRSNWGIGEPLSQNVGYGFRFDTGQNILLLFNGQRLNAFLPGNRFGIEEYILDDIERIEVVRGPGSTLYGANAFTSVVNLISKKRLDPGETATVRESGQWLPTSGGAVGQGSWAAPLGRGFTSGAIRFQGEAGQNLLIRNDLFGDTYVRDSVRHAIDVELFYRLDQLNVYVKIDDQLRNTFTGFDAVNPDSIRQLSLYGHAYSLGADHTLKLSDRVELKNSVGLHFDNWTEVFLIPIFRLAADGQSLVVDGQGNPILDPQTITRNGKTITTPFVIDGQGGETVTAQIESQLTWNYLKENQFIGGIDVNYDRVIGAKRPTEVQIVPSQFIPFQTLTDPANNWLFDVHASRITIGGYAQAGYNLGSRFSLVAGTRLDVYGGRGSLNQTYTAFNPRGGIVFKDVRTGNIKALYGRATRVPNGFETLSSVGILGSPTNRPEQIGTFQLAWDKSWTSRFITQLGGFSSTIEHHLQTDAQISDQLKALGFVGQFTNVNTGSTLTSRGIDGKVSWTLGPVDLSANFTQYLYTRNALGNSIAYIPQTMINGNVNLPIGNFNLNLNANYRANFTKAPEDPRPKVPNYVLLGATLGYHLQALPLELRLGGRNLLNTQIEYPSSNLSYPNNFPSRGVEAWGEVRLTQAF